MLHGEVVPVSWHTVNAVLIALCRLAGRDPDAIADDDSSGWSWAYSLEHYWHEALDEGPVIAHPLPDDEPPF